MPTGIGKRVKPEIKRPREITPFKTNKTINKGEKMMTNTNKVSINIAAEDSVAIQESIKTLQTKLLPYLVTLSPIERKELPKMGDKTVSFVQKTQEYCKQNPELVPQFLDVNALNTNIEAFEQIRSMYQPLLQITDSLWGTMILSGSEAYLDSLKFYNSAKNATKSKTQKAETIYNDLASRFPGRSKKNVPVAQTQLTNSAN
jgi:hypothetical protein